MAKLSPTEYAEKWGRRLKGSSEDIRRGISRVTEAPGVAAAKQADLMKAKINEALDSGRWARNVAAVSLEDWKKKATDKGIARIGVGVDAAQTGQVQMAEKLLAAVDATNAEVAQTPRGDLEANITRMTTFARGMHKRKFK